MGRLLLTAALVFAGAGCSVLFEPPSGGAFADDGGPGEDGGEGDADSGACAWPEPPLHFDPCAAGEPVELSLDMPSIPDGDGNDIGYVLHTDNGDLERPDGIVVSLGGTPHAPPQGPEVWLVVAESCSIAENVKLRAAGPRPLLLACRGDARVAGVLDVGSIEAGADRAARGAGSREDCGQNEPVSGGASLSAGGGGGGGGFGEAGAAGGSGDEGIAGGGGRGGAEARSTVLRGGCPGADGGAPTTGPPGGAAGGALQISAELSIEVSGTLAAGGGGGKGGLSGTAGGGGGGGSGGLILLDAPSIMFTTGATVHANGGGGGEGGNNSTAAGDDGSDGDFNGAGGGSGMTGAAGDGGDGGHREAGAEGGQSAGTGLGGGGGGGGVGFIILHGQVENAAAASFSPAPHLVD